MGKMILYHGTPDKEVTPTYGLGDDKHDYGRGFYLSEDIELAKEWAYIMQNTEAGQVVFNGSKDNAMMMVIEAFDYSDNLLNSGAKRFLSPDLQAR